MKQVLVTSIGGLGNQMFCYAFYKKMGMEYPHIEFKMDLSGIRDTRFERNAEFLRVFPNINVCSASAKEIWKAERKYTFTYHGKGSRIIRYFVDAGNRFSMQSGKRYCITEEEFERRNRKIGEAEWDQILYFDGFWQNIDYYENIMPELQNDFTFAEITDKENNELMRQIRECESVAVHIRRGDYVGETLDILDSDYYGKIIKKIQSEIPTCQFYFFSNDAAYVEKEFAWLEAKSIVKNNVGTGSFRDMQLMSLCKHNIIANSTFSIWAALLNTYPDKQVYYPSHYYKGIEMQDIKQKGFIRVNVEE